MEYSLDRIGNSIKKSRKTLLILLLITTKVSAKLKVEWTHEISCQIIVWVVKFYMSLKTTWKIKC